MLAGSFIISLVVLHARASQGCTGGMCEEDSIGANFLQVGVSSVRRAPAHPWPGPFHKMQYSSTNEVVPSFSSLKPSWNWSAPIGRFNTTIAGGPVIDYAGNFYVVTHHGVHKISPDGVQLWFHMFPVLTNNMVSLFGDTVLGSRAGDGTAFALDINTGDIVWETKLAKESGGDSAYPAQYNGIFVVGAVAGRDRRSPGGSVEGGGNTQVFALNATTGAQLWRFTPEAPVWNLAPLFPDDDHTVFQDFVGNVYKLSLKTGNLVWKTLAAKDQESFSDGGAMLGPSMVYTCSNIGAARGGEGTGGALRAYGLSDGKMAWEQTLPSPCLSYPAVGKLAGASDLSVVVAPGAFIGTENIHGSIMAFAAITGKRQWQYQAPVWHGVMARNDPPPDYLAATLCIPAHWSAPVITGDGSVLAERIDGLLYKVYDSLQGQREPLDSNAPSELDFETTHGVQVETIDLDRSSLHGAFAFAPNTMALTTCDSLFVFRY